QMFGCHLITQSAHTDQYLLHRQNRTRHIQNGLFDLFEKMTNRPSRKQTLDLWTPKWAQHHDGIAVLCPLRNDLLRASIADLKAVTCPLLLEQPDSALEDILRRVMIVDGRGIQSLSHAEKRDLGIQNGRQPRVLLDGWPRLMSSIGNDQNIRCHIFIH